MRILLVEDEPTLGRALVSVLEGESHAVDWAQDGNRADELAAVNDYDLVVLDWTLPRGPSGFDLLRRWREQGRSMPILMLTARSELSDRVDGLDEGADDYLVKPFEIVELLARIRSLLRRRERPIAHLKAGDVELDRRAKSVKVGGEVMALAPKELGVLEYLLSRKNETVTRTELVEHVWDDSFDAMSNVVDVIIYRLRKKIDGGREQKLLRTVKGVGYRLSDTRSQGWSSDPSG